VTRIAFVSDMHGNMVALQAALADLSAREPFDTVVGGGDYCLSGAYPAECVARARALGWACVRGNTDEWVVAAATDGRIPVSAHPAAQAHDVTTRAADAWVAARLPEDAVIWLSELPHSWRTAGPSGQTLMFVHATPWNVHDAVRRHSSDADKLRMLDAAGTDALVYGHVHDAYLQRFGARTLVCAGSVGAPMDGDTRGAYLIAEDAGTGWAFEHVRVPYDLAGYIATLESCGQPGADGFARKLRAASFGA
jgi:predicted phosphodiesterase